MLSAEDRIVKYLSGIVIIGGYLGLVVGAAVAAFFLR